jgi:hypothetical protein
MWGGTAPAAPLPSAWTLTATVYGVRRPGANAFYLIPGDKYCCLFEAARASDMCPAPPCEYTLQVIENDSFIELTRYQEGTKGYLPPGRTVSWSRHTTFTKGGKEVTALDLEQALLKGHRPLTGVRLVFLDSARRTLREVHLPAGEP